MNKVVLIGLAALCSVQAFDFSKIPIRAADAHIKGFHPVRTEKVQQRYEIAH